MIRYRKTLPERVFDAVNLLLLALFAFVCLYPMYQSLILSLNDGKDAMSGGIYLLPRKWTLDNYKAILGNTRLLDSFVVTVARTVIGTILSILVTSMMAFALSKKELVLGKLYTVLCIVTMYFGGGLIPYYLLIRSLHLIDSFWVLVLPGVLSIWNMLVFKSFFSDIPESLEESARIDGAHYITIFFRLILPVSMPAYAALSLFTAVGLWNEWFSAMLFLNKRQDLMPLQSILNAIINQTTAIEELQKKTNASGAVQQLSNVTTRSVIVTNMVFISAPIIVLYPFLQKYFVKGVMLGSIKG